MLMFSYKVSGILSSRAFTSHCLMEVDYTCTIRFSPLSFQRSLATNRDNLLSCMLFKTSETFLALLRD